MHSERNKAIKSVLKRVFTVGLCLYMVQAEAGYRVRSVRVAGRSYLLLRDVAGFYGMQYRGDDSMATLSSKYSHLRFRQKQRSATINGVKVHLSDACAAWRHELAVSKTDFQLVMEPILRSKTLSPRPIRRVMIDPGHGGRDPGAQNSHGDEKDITLGVARHLYRVLKKSGYDVYLTRTGDQARSLTSRVEAAGRYQSDLFISLHVNAVGSQHVSGVETYLLTPEGTPSTYSNRAKSEASPGNAYDRENSRLAYEIQREVVDITGADDRGTKHADFVVLREVPCAAVLIEMGFLTNLREAANLKSPAYQRRLAVGIARGIRRFHQAVNE